jgi:hypothetical protein
MAVTMTQRAILALAFWAELLLVLSLFIVTMAIAMPVTVTGIFSTKFCQCEHSFKQHGKL